MVSELKTVGSLSYVFSKKKYFRYPSGREAMVKGQGEGHKTYELYEYYVYIGRVHCLRLI
jgi:hypothetical protein